MNSLWGGREGRGFLGRPDPAFTGHVAGAAQRGPSGAGARLPAAGNLIFLLFFLSSTFSNPCSKYLGSLLASEPQRQASWNLHEVSAVASDQGLNPISTTH